MSSALEEAKAVLEDESASQSAVDEATQALIHAIGNLTYTIQKLHLKTALSVADQILALEMNYEETSALSAAAAEGRKILNAASASQEDADLAAYAILDELFKLAKKADVTSLESLIDAAEELLDGNYTSESLDNLKKAIDDAKAVIADPDRADDAIGKAYEGLIDAIISLEATGNKAALIAMIQKGNEVLAQADDYVASSIQGLEQSLEDAQAVYDNKDAVQSEIDAAVRSLTLKIAEARLKGDVNGDGRVNTNDSTELLKANAELTELSDIAKASADVNGDGKITTSDAVRILQYAAEQISEF